MSRSLPRLPLLTDPGPPSGERADAARNREKILAATRALLTTRPIAEIGMDEVAQWAGVGKGTVYRRFVDRSSLCLALLDENERAFQTQALQGFGLPRGASGRDRLFALLEALFRFSWENRGLLAEAEAFSKAGTSYHTHAVWAWRRVALERTMAKAKDEGAIGEIDGELTALVLLESFRPSLLLYLHGRGGKEEELLRRYRDVWASLLQVSSRK